MKVVWKIFHPIVVLEIFPTNNEWKYYRSSTNFPSFYRKIYSINVRTAMGGLYIIFQMIMVWQTINKMSILKISLILPWNRMHSLKRLHGNFTRMLTQAK